MILSYSFCNVSVLPLRKDPSHRSEQVTQLLFGEKAEILEVTEQEWAKVRIEWDGYEGWCRFSQLAPVSKKEYGKEVKFITAKHTDKLVFEDSEMWLPIGSEFTKTKLTIQNQAGKYKGKKLSVKELALTEDNLKRAALQYLNAPYLWGGKTIAGIDCSGLTQMAFRFCNRKIPRDASQQAVEGEIVDFLQHARCGDLAFFDNSEGKITHVGLLVDNKTIIHSTETSGRVVIDPIDQGGIISRALKKRTHQLRMVKRYF